MAADGFRKYDPFFGKWRLVREEPLERGTSSDVYEICRDDTLGNQEISALKVMHIPRVDALYSQMQLQQNKEAVRSYFSRQLDRIKDELWIMRKCKGHSNIVSYEEYQIIESGGDYGIGWDILIRMELLHPITVDYLHKNNATQYDIICMWRDIANALIFCDNADIIHRDIKRSSIMVSESGKFKLTHFDAALEVKGKGAPVPAPVDTGVYMTPEAYGKRSPYYDKRADYYLLGQVIYYYLNHYRHVFWPQSPWKVKAKAADRAQWQRLRGDKIPRIRGVSEEINQLLEKSLSPIPSGRPKDAQELYDAIQKILEEQGLELKRKPLGGVGRDGRAMPSDFGKRLFFNK